MYLKVMICYFPPMHNSNVSFRPGHFILRALQDGTGSLSDIEGCPLLAQVDVLNCRTPGWLVTMKQTQGSAKADWEELHVALGRSFQILPVLCNEMSSDRYPDGILSVRFKDIVTTADLKKLSEKYDLKLVRQTPRILVQAQFSLCSPATVFLPDVVQNVMQEEDIEAAWMDADSAFIRLRR